MEVGARANNSIGSNLENIRLVQKRRLVWHKTGPAFVIKCAEAIPVQVSALEAHEITSIRNKERTQPRVRCKKMQASSNLKDQKQEDCVELSELFTCCAAAYCAQAA